MSNTQALPIIASIKQLHGYFANLTEILTKDKRDFAKKDLAQLESNNKQKNFLINQISDLVHEIKPVGTKSFFEGIETAAANFDAGARQEIKTHIEQLKSTMSDCYKHLLTNSNIVYANLQQIKNIWDKLLALNTQTTCTYDISTLNQNRSKEDHAK